MSTKTPIYFVPGLAANTKIFENLNLSKDLFETHFIAWKIPLSKNETIESYAQRMCCEIKHKNPILIGVSFGGVMVQEMSKIINPKKVFIISSIKSNKELPNRLKITKKTKVYKLFPTQIAENFEAYEKYFLGDFLQKKAELYKTYMSVKDPLYLKWAIHTVLHWQQNKPIKNITHIHGVEDVVFPIKYIQNCIPIKNGTHAMILTKAKTITKIITEKLLLECK